MFKIPVNISILFKRLFIILLLYTVCRLLFFIFNAGYFRETSFVSLLLIFFYGIRFDICVIALTNILFISLHAFPLNLFYRKGYQSVLKFLFYAVNIPAILFNAIDFIYFKFSNKRTTADFFKLFGLGEDMVNTFPRIVADFWYIPLIASVMFYLAHRMYRGIKVPVHHYEKTSVIPWLYGLLLIPSYIIAARGGLQYVPLNILSASQYATPRFTPLVLNTPFTIVKTFGKTGLERKQYFNEQVLPKYFSLQRDYSGRKSFQPYNIIVIIMESFSKEYIGSMNNKPGFTPFLDSLSTHSLVFTRAFANSKKSMEGIPAVLASMPQLMSNPYLTSAYNGDEMVTLANLLRKKNYTSWFFHGGINGTMGFDRFARMGGFDHYVGKNEYPHPDDFDGNWGIYDEPFFKFFANSLDKSPTPFVAGFFSLSSHHPYSIPDSLQGRFRKGNLPIQESIMYADHSLKRFFETASTKPWFNNTLFVITADHTGPAEFPFYQNKAGMYSIPILFYMPGKIEPAVSEMVCQQADIVPSVLDFTGYDQPFNSFGSSVFDSSAHHIAFNYIDNIYQLIQNNYLLQFDGTSATGLFRYDQDSTLSVNLLQQEPQTALLMTSKIKAVIQQYNNRLISNSLTKP